MGMRIAVIGAGSWGTALAKLLVDKGEEVCLWAHEAEVVAAINQKQRNPYFLSDIRLPRNLSASGNLEEVISDAQIVVSVVPSHVVRSLWNKAKGFLSKRAIVISCTKGIEEKGFNLMSQVLDECLCDHPADQRVVLSGPSFAHEVALGRPTSVVIAGTKPVVVKRIQKLFRTPSFLTFTSDDVIGVQVGGAVKNVIAIAAGISDGLRLGHNARAAIITRGLYEAIKIGVALGAHRLTFAGLSGIGDLVLTCTGECSRNYTVGKALGKGRSTADIKAKMHMVAEGMATAKAVARLGRTYQLRLPICNAVHRILKGTLAPRDALHELTSLTLHEELGVLRR